MKLPPTFIEGTDDINIIVECPKDSRIKYVYDEKLDLFLLSKILPMGMAFPLPFGFIPGTKGEDGDPVDVLILLEEICAPGTLVECRIIGAIEADQTEKGITVKNDRLIAVAKESKIYAKIDSISALDKNLLRDITAFFKNYNELAGKEFTVTNYAKPAKAIELIKKSIQ